jgi:hypothetical protein
MKNFYSKVFGQDSEVKSETAALEFIKGLGKILSRTK